MTYTPLELKTEYGTAYVFQKSYALDTTHGHWPFQTWLTCSPKELMRGRKIEPSRCLFLDIETSEMGDMGTLPFMVGVGWFEHDQYILWQYFLREPEDEPAMLASLSELIQSQKALVTFNGKHFDVPVLEQRFKMNNQQFGLKKFPNLDLLPFARLRWKNSLPSRRLIHLERDVLGIQRTSEDVQGYQIPGMYAGYLSDNDFEPIRQILYHNEMDVISMVTLATELTQANQEPRAKSLTWHHMMDMGLWYLRHGKIEQAEKALIESLERIPPPEQQIFMLEKLTDIFTKSGREKDAVPYWELWHELDDVNPEPRLALAKHYETIEHDLEKALYWCELALDAAENLPLEPQRGMLLAAIQKRLKRLRK